MEAQRRSSGSATGRTSLAAGVHDVSKRFGATQALSRVSFDIRQDEIHGLVGRNGAGKSTLVGLLTGMIAPDEGHVELGDLQAPALSDRREWQRRVACVYQKPTVVPELTVAENIFLGRMPRGRYGAISWREARLQGQAALDEWDMGISVDWLAHRLTVEQRQVVEVVRALLLGSTFVILDEPTAGLRARESERLFHHIRRLRDQGVAVMYISHHLNEVFDLCDRVTVLRDGTWVESTATSRLTPRLLVDAMVGDRPRKEHHADEVVPIVVAEDGTPALEVRDLTISEWCEGIGLSVRAGECVALAGLAGSGKLQVAEAIAGLRRPDSGHVLLKGQRMRTGRVDSAIRSGVGYVAEDRYARGFVKDLSVAENLTMTISGRLGRGGWIKGGRQNDTARALVGLLDIKVSSVHQKVAELSGGNQQKVTFGRALASEPTVLVLAYPTAGVDIASKETLFEAIREARGRGLAVLVVSDEIDELRIADRVIVMFQGEVFREVAGGWDERELVSTMEGIVHGDD
jgi:simple sugar transport system ATP-binding protein